MKSTHFGGLVLILLLFAAKSPAQELTTDIYPSENELASALERGEIDSAQYYYLWQLQLFGLDSSNTFLEDLIPNLIHFLPLGQEMTTPLEHDQRRPFVQQRVHKRRIGHLRQRWYRTVSEHGPWAFSTDLALSPVRRIDLDLSIRRSRAGTERFVRRSLTWMPARSALYRVTLGNFSTRFGMGTVIGHPGKRVDYPDRIDTQSMLFPDYGGYNGLLTEWRIGACRASTIAAIARGNDYELTTAASMLEHSFRRSRFGLIAAHNRLRRRSDDRTANNLNLGVTSQTRYTSGYVRGEISYQLGNQLDWRAAMLEGRQRFRDAQVSYALWTYGNHWHDLTSGSKSAILRLPDTVSTVGFAYSSRRVGQRGGLLRTILKLHPSLALTNDLVAGYHQGGSNRFQWLAALDWQSSRSLNCRFDLLVNDRYLTTATDSRQNTLRMRLQSRFTRAQWSLRTYIAFQNNTDRPDHAALLCDAHIDSTCLGTVDLWINVARLNPKQRTLDYCYMYLQLTQRYLESVEIELKLAHRYARDYSQSHQTTVAIATAVII